MKKIFTFVAAAMLAVGANAQDILKLDATATYKDADVLKTDNASVTLGNDMKNETWTFENTELKGDYVADFLVDCKDKDGKDINGVVNIHGENNPKDGTTSGSGSGIDCSDGKTNASLPQNGTYYIFKADVAGKVQFGVVLNGDKAFYLLDTTEAYQDGEKIRITLPENNIKNYVMKDAEGKEVEFNGGEDKGGLKVKDKTIGFIEFDAAEGHSYYLFCSGSKLGFWGYKFTPENGETGISAVQTGTVANGAVYNLAGQQVDASYKGIVIKDGKKFVQK